MGCGIGKLNEEHKCSIVERNEKNNSSAQSLLLIRYQTNQNIYNIKLKPAKLENALNS